MIKLWLVFIILAVVTHLSIAAWRNMSGQAQWTLTKSVLYSTIIVLLVILAMTGIVTLF